MIHPHQARRFPAVSQWGILRSDLVVSLVICLAITVAFWGVAILTSSHRSPIDSRLYEVAQADAVVALAGEDGRWAFGQLLIERGYAPRLISTLLNPSCLQQGHPLEACGTGVRNTVDEAIAMRRIFEQEHLHRVTIVTSDYHALRSGAVFAIVFAGSGIDVHVMPATGLPAPRLSQLWHELVTLGPSLVGALVARCAPGMYEFRMQQRYA